MPKQAIMFLSVLSHHKKNCVVKHDFIRSPCTGCLGALDGTFVDVRVLEHEKGRYRTRKGQVAVNVLGFCNPNLQFIFVLSGWEGSATDSRVLWDAIHRPNGLRVPTGNYYLCDNGYANADGFLMPYRGVRYHLREWDRRTEDPLELELPDSREAGGESGVDCISSTMDADFISTAHVNTLEGDGSSQQKHRGNNKDRSGPRRTWTIVEEEALINGLKSLVTMGLTCDNAFGMDI
ncbi:UNVERIFIED_CONTAM: hypothetical protein Slati_0421300 [Sesamum latifolium]|uniref:DDE Tnp4 domain-containing protein n=1 Tax=Sesamum latifolium TaxID=2727402 RepID=A0AAW2XVX1_9LAMI